MQNLRRLDAIDRQVALADPARRRARPHVGELVPLRPMGDEIESGMRAAVDDDPARVHALLQPQLGQRLSEPVGADRGEIGGVGTEPRRGDHRVRRVAAKTLYERRVVVRLIEFDQRLANRKKVRHAHLVATATATPAMTPPAARWAMRMALADRNRARARLAARA